MSLNNLIEFQKLHKKVKEYKIPLVPSEGEEQITIKIKPISIDDLTLVSSLNANETEANIKAMKPLIAKSLDMEEKDIEEISFEYLVDIIQCILQANGLDKLKEKQGSNKIKEFIESKKNG